MADDWDDDPWNLDIGDDDLDWVGVATVDADADKIGVPADILPGGESVVGTPSAKFQVTTFPQGAYTGQAKSQFEIEYSATGGWTGEGEPTTGRSVSISFGVVGVGASTNEGLGDTLGHIGIAAKLGDSFWAKQSKLGDPSILMGGETGDTFELEASFTTGGVELDLENEVADIPFKYQLTSQAEAVDGEGIVTSMHGLEVSVSPQWWKIVESE